MSNMRIGNLFQVQYRFLRSTHLERDFVDASSLDGYILTPQNRINLQRIAKGLALQSRQRAWRITGDYGSGKSSFGLILAHIFSGGRNHLPDELRYAIHFDDIGVPEPNLQPVLVTGSREPLAIALLRSLHNTLRDIYSRGRIPTILRDIEKCLDSLNEQILTEDSVIQLLEKASDHVRISGKGSGLLIILDELGKFLEYAALHPEQQDVYFLQLLGEAAARSARSPLFVVGLLHQGFHSYADQLSQVVQKEWEKIASRYEEVLFDEPLEETTYLIGRALNVQIECLPEVVVIQARRDMEATLSLGWYGPSAVKAKLIEYAPRLYPLHPSVIPVLARIFRRFGQNERSLFSFLFSNEPFGLQTFADKIVDVNHFYRIHDLYDYARTTFGHRLGIQSYRSHWQYIESVIESFPATKDNSLPVLKTVGLLNLLDTQDLLASDSAILLAVNDTDATSERQVQAAIKSLQADKHVLYYRGAAGGYCLWPYTSVNLDKIYEQAVRAIGNTDRVAPLIERRLEARPLVARRHYIETGNLRHFEIRYSPVNELSTKLEINFAVSDGIIIVPLCETEEEWREAIQFAQLSILSVRPEVLVAVPRRLNSLAGLVQEVQRWEWIAENTPELNHDLYAAAEVSRQISASRHALEQRLENFIGLQQSLGKTELQWFRQAQPVIVSNNVGLLAYLSNVCDEVYYLAPKVHNELVNRRTLSSAAAAARMRLIERIFSTPSEPLLGMDPNKKPAEMAMYLSVLRQGGLHQQHNEEYTLREPDNHSDICNLRPTMDRILHLLESVSDRRVKVSDLFNDLRHPPYGVRDGLSALLLAVFIKRHERSIAIYEDNRFLRAMVGFDFQRLIKAPETFEIQFYRTTEVRTDLLNKLRSVIAMKSSQTDNVTVIDIVRPLAIFAAQLPPFTQKTNKLSSEAQAIRIVLLDASEPTTLLFKQLPQACGFDAFGDNSNTSSEKIQQFIIVLKRALDELKEAYPGLQQRLKDALARLFEEAETFQAMREALSQRAERILDFISEARLKTFCLRLSDRNLSEDAWIEAIGSFVCAKPPLKWTDSDEQRFNYELDLLRAHFLRVESIVFSLPNAARDASAVRVSITQPNGHEVDKVLYITNNEESEVQQIETLIKSLLDKHGRIGLLATSRAVWKILSQDMQE